MRNGDAVVRRAQPVDMQGLAGLCQEHAQFERVAYDPHGKAARLAAALFCDPPRLQAWVGEAGDELVGYACAAREYSTWSAGEYLHMDCLFVRAGSRGAGLGAALLEAVIAYAHAAGIAQIQWQTPEWNVDAARFYRRHGGIATQKLRFTHGGNALISLPAQANENPA